MNGHLGGTQNTLHIIALSRLAPPAKILDMGAGAGETVGLLRDMGYDARGIDIRPGNDMVEKGDFLRCPYPDAAFDGIISQCAFFVGGDVSGRFRRHTACSRAAACSCLPTCALRTWKA